jgi:hypothetical protein
MTLNAKQVTASVVGAVLAAFALSFLGVGGTIAGVAIGSAATTITSTLALRSLEKGHAKVREIVQTDLAPAPDVPGPAPLAINVPEATVTIETPEGPLSVGPASPAPPPLNDAYGRQRRQWPLIALMGLVFVLALATVTAIELAAGKPISSVVSGSAPPARTSIGDLFGGTTTTSSTTTTTSSDASSTTTSSSTSTTSTPSTTTTSSTTTTEPS